MEPQSTFPDTDSITIGELAREAGISLRAFRFYQSKRLLAPQRNGHAKVFSADDRDRLTLKGKRFGFTLGEIREMLAARIQGCDMALAISRKKCIEKILSIWNISAATSN
jgi:DNA-binding transcriptional MerR regulator